MKKLFLSISIFSILSFGASAEPNWQFPLPTVSKKDLRCAKKDNCMWAEETAEAVKAFDNLASAIKSSCMSLFKEDRDIASKKCADPKMMNDPSDPKVLRKMKSMSEALQNEWQYTYEMLDSEDGKNLHVSILKMSETDILAEKEKAMSIVENLEASRWMYRESVEAILQKKMELTPRPKK